jgi:hypothetical protein
VILLRLAFELATLLALALALGVAQKNRTTPGRISFAALALACMLWSLGEALLMRGVVSAWTAERIAFAGMLGLPALWLGFTAHAAGLEVARRVPWFGSIFLLPGASFYLLLYSSRWGSLFSTMAEGGVPQYGPLWTFWAVYAHLLAVGGTVILIVTAVRWPHREQVAQPIVLGVAPLLPLAGNLIYRWAGATWPADPTPVLVAITLLALRSALFPGGMMQTLPISQRELLHQLPFGLILTDRFGTVVEINDVASSRLQTTEDRIVGKSLGSALAATGVAPLRSTPLRHWGRAVGEIIIV